MKTSSCLGWNLLLPRLSLKHFGSLLEPDRQKANKQLSQSEQSPVWSKIFLAPVVLRQEKAGKVRFTNLKRSWFPGQHRPAQLDLPLRAVPRASSERGARCWLCLAVPDKDPAAEESMTLINSVCNVLPEELPVSGSPNMSVLFGDALSGITIKLQRCVIAPNGCKSRLTLLAAQVVECERRGAVPRYRIWVRSLYSKKDFSVGFF